MTKEFAAETKGAVSLDFFELRSADMEEKLSQLTLWVIEAERARQPYRLRLPGLEISPALGQMHFHRCLRALSLFEVGSARCADRTPQRGVPTSSEHEHE
jgi:uncharacterized protein (DUF58 family)